MSGILEKETSSYASDPELNSLEKEEFQQPVQRTETELQVEVEELAQSLGINQKKLMWKIDLCVVPAFCLLYFLSFLDRVNISNANLYGLAEDLNLTGNQYNIALTVFFVPYIVFEVLANYCIKFVKPHIWLSTLIFLFGGISIGMGFVTNFGGLVACRFLIGITEASTFPSIFYLLSTYYSKHESQRRFSAFFSCTALAGAASGAIAFKINDLDGVHGIAAWQWVFIIEGAITMGCAFLLFFTIADFPEESRFLSHTEREFLKRKLEILSGSVSAYEIKNSLKDVGKCFKDILIWLPALAYFGLIIPSYGYAYFAATIIKQMGYTAVSANQHSVYPWLAAFVLINVVAFISDRFKRRLPFALASSFLAIIGLAMVLGAKHTPRIRYAGCFLTASGLYTAMPLIVCWAALNNGSHLRKSVGTAWQIGFGNIGGIIATFIFLAADAPVYKPGLVTCIAAVIFSILASIAYFFAVLRLNKAKKTEAYIQKFNELPSRERINAGDRNPNFVYLY
ncbi:high-affinity nicotinic acid transporter [Scheffersomyces coipomensis]|uniref:high-affinity nicotinic acid transporter n=1 Tax=Scheffersomyces coipomensis TaxID=1788519 RepID=UPI00315C5226